jgi:hypothetical protein
MASTVKQKIQKNLDTMNEDELRSAFIVLQEIKNRNQKIIINNTIIENNISVGSKQLKEGLGTDFGSFFNKVKMQYGSKK